jgi:hypothetical protein
MPQGYGANFADVVDEKVLMHVVPKEFVALSHLIEEFCDGNWDGFAASVARERDWEGPTEWDKDKIRTAYGVLVDAFKEKTGADIGLQYHCQSDEGGCYDEVDGTFWEMWNHRQDIPGIVALKQQLNNGLVYQRRFYVNYG